MRSLTLLAGVALLALGLAPQAGAEPPRSFFGVAPQRIPLANEIERMGEGNVGTLRFQLRWSAIDPTSVTGDFNWSEPDQVVANAALAGIDPLPFVFNTPAWVPTELDGQTCGEDCFAYPPRSEAALGAWREFLGAAAARYGPNGQFWADHPEIPPHPIRAWQIWNEQNSPPFYRPRPDVGRYAMLLAHAAYAIKTVDPEAEIVLGGMFASPLRGRLPALTSFRFLKVLYRMGWPELAFDGVAAHPYSATIDGVRDQLERLRKRMRLAGDGRTSLWITEVGWSSARGNHPFHEGPVGQADRLRSLLDYVVRHRHELRLENLIWFSWRDESSGLPVCDWCPESGLFREASLSPKPAWRAFTEFTGGR